MGVVSRGFGARPGSNTDPRIPPGQYRTDDFPVLTAGPTPLISTAEWAFDVVTANGAGATLSWQQLMDLPSEHFTVDIHCVTRWSKLGTSWRGVPVSTILDHANADLAANHFAMVRSYGDYTTNLPLDDLLDGKAWVVFEYEGKPLPAAHGGPARLLVPHLYFWKSAKWVNGIELRAEDRPGFWEGLGYHAYGDPWREQRYVGD
jgi:DMSO/TMAO reductase YedYZ molybdopterin-dependent catalytic subunit